MKVLRGRNVLITGGALGMGKSLARLLLQEGCRVALVDIREGDLTQPARALTHREVYAFVCDISDREKVYGWAEVGRVRGHR